MALAKRATEVEQRKQTELDSNLKRQELELKASQFSTHARTGGGSGFVGYGQQNGGDRERLNYGNQPNNNSGRGGTARGRGGLGYQNHGNHRGGGGPPPSGPSGERAFEGIPSGPRGGNGRPPPSGPRGTGGDRYPQSQRNDLPPPAAVSTSQNGGPQDRGPGSPLLRPSDTTDPADPLPPTAAPPAPPSDAPPPPPPTDLPPSPPPKEEEEQVKEEPKLTLAEMAERNQAAAQIGGDYSAGPVMNTRLNAERYLGQKVPDKRKVNLSPIPLPPFP